MGAFKTRPMYECFRDLAQRVHNPSPRFDNLDASACYGKPYLRMQVEVGKSNQLSDSTTEKGALRSKVNGDQVNARAAQTQQRQLFQVVPDDSESCSRRSQDQLGAFRKGIRGFFSLAQASRKYVVSINRGTLGSNRYQTTASSCEVNDGLV